MFGATGVVGFASSIIAALEGADVRLVAHRGVERVIKSAEISKERFGVDLDAVAGETPEQKRADHRRCRSDFRGRRRRRPGRLERA